MQSDATVETPVDFHTPPDISGIGKRFDKRRRHETLKAAAVNSVPLFSKCHHGRIYHPASVGKRVKGRAELVVPQPIAARWSNSESPIQSRLTFGVFSSSCAFLPLICGKNIDLGQEKVRFVRYIEENQW